MKSQKYPWGNWQKIIVAADDKVNYYDLDLNEKLAVKFKRAKKTSMLEKTKALNKKQIVSTQPHRVPIKKYNYEHHFVFSHQALQFINISIKPDNIISSDQCPANIKSEETGNTNPEAEQTALSKEIDIRIYNENNNGEIKNSPNSGNDHKPTNADF